MSYKKIVYTTFQLGLCCIFFFAAQRLAAQNTTTLQAMVRDAGGKAIEQATVLLNNTLHGVSDKRGQISFRNIRPGEYAYTASCVGYNEAQGRLVVKGDGKDTLQIVLWPLTLQLAEVTVTARQQAMGARSIIGQEAIRHLQPKSVADLLQLLPGALTVNPTLNTIAQASLRDTEENMNNAKVNEALLKEIEEPTAKYGRYIMWNESGHHSHSQILMFLPNQWVIDAVNVRFKGAATEKSFPISGTLDKGWNGVYEKADDKIDVGAGKMITRRFNGKRLSDTNNSSVDFEVKKVVVPKK